MDRNKTVNDDGREASGSGENIPCQSTQSLHYVPEAVKYLREAMDRRANAKNPADIRNAAIVCLSGLITLGRGAYGPEYIQVATELQGALEDLNAGKFNRMFERTEGEAGRPPAARHLHAVLATASALVNHKRAEYGTKAKWTKDVATRFGVDTGTLKNFTKKITSRTPPSASALSVYNDTIRVLRDNEWTAEDALERLADMIDAPL